MSEGKTGFKPDVVVRNTVQSMKAFGYVDRAWIESAFAVFYARHLKKKSDKPVKPGLWARIFKAIGLGGPAKPTPYELLEQRAPGRAALRLLQSVLSQAARGGDGRHGRRGATSRRSIEGVIKDADPDELKLVAKFLRESGLEETGFPVRLIGEDGALAEAPRSSDVSSEPPVTPARRSEALSTLTGGLLYRFAYDHDKKLKWEDTRKVFRASGLYRVYVVPADPSFVERRLLLVRLDDDGAIVRAAEIRKPRDRYVVRGGYVIPASGVNTFIMSSDFSPEVLADMIEKEISPQARKLVFPDGAPADAQTSASFLQEHQLGFYSLFSRGEGELRGAVLEAPTPATAVGYRIDPSEIDLASQETVRNEDGELVSRPPELGFLTFDEVEGRRDKILIAALGRNPAVSIELG